MDQGIFLVEGGLFSISEFSIRVKDEGIITNDPITIMLNTDVFPIWIEIAFDHVLAAKQAADVLERARAEQNDNLIGQALKKEFPPGMQAIVACGIAVDAFYMSVKPYSGIPEEMQDAWKKNGTARYKQIAETLKSAFSLSNKDDSTVKHFLRELFRFRDLVVHPKQTPIPPSLHPELNKIVDWRYAFFRYYNAYVTLKLTISLTHQLIRRQKRRNALNPICTRLQPILNELVSRWESNFDSLYSEAEHTSGIS